MGKLVYTANQSLDGYTVDPTGSFDWGVPIEEVHNFITALERSVGTYLYGRRMYQTMQLWETMDELGAVMQDYATVWRAATKIVVSRTLTEVSSERTRIVRELDPLFVEQLKLGESDISIGGPTLAAHAIRHRLVDEYRLFVYPVVVGGGTPFWPAEVRMPLTLLDQRQFDHGVVYLCYCA
jgi:dihydrofolate reductase